MAYIQSRPSGNELYKNMCIYIQWHIAYRIFCFQSFTGLTFLGRRFNCSHSFLQCQWFGVDHCKSRMTRRRASPLTALSHARDNLNLSPPLLFSDGSSTLSHTASLTPLSNHLSSLSRMTTSLVLKEWLLCCRWVKTAESNASPAALGLLCCFIRALRACFVSPMYASRQSWDSWHWTPYTMLDVFSFDVLSFTWTRCFLSVQWGLNAVWIPCLFIAVFILSDIPATYGMVTSVFLLVVPLFSFFSMFFLFVLAAFLNAQVGYPQLFSAFVT